MVVVFHVFVHLEVRDIIPVLPELASSGRAGVDIFFVISGFIMVYIGWEKFGVHGAQKDFFIRRIIRIAPIYWFYTLLMAGLVYLFPQLVSQGKTLSAEHLLASLAFVPWANTVGDIKPVLSVGWTINFEMFFYLVFAMLLFFHRMYFVPLLSIILLGGFALGLVFNLDKSALHVATSPLLVEFLFGGLIGLCYRRGIRIQSSVCIFLAAFGAGLLIITAFTALDEAVHRTVKWGIPSALLLFGAVFLERNGNLSAPRLLNSLGDSSYSLYLTHVFVINAIGTFWAARIDGYYSLFICLAFLGSLFAGHVAYLFLEKPVTDSLNRRYSKKSALPLVPA
jgi:peptidoglycan/LPS O-acetylase OafA/YrhL